MGHRLGRSGLLSWATINAELVGAAPGPWPAGTAVLRDLGLLEAEAHERIQRQWHFGQLIANTDMHEGNLSFLPAAPGTAALRPAPAYDMQPMLYAPQRGVELVEQVYAPALPLPDERAAWHIAARAAMAFWQAAAADDRISAGFRGICRANEGRLRALAAHPSVA